MLVNGPQKVAPPPPPPPSWGRSARSSVVLVCSKTCGATKLSNGSLIRSRLRWPTTLPLRLNLRGNFLPDDCKNDVEADEDTREDGQAPSHQPDGAPQYHFNKEDVLHRLQGRSLSGLIRELLLHILWRASAVFSTTHVGASQLVKKYTKFANEYFLDEAAATTIPESAQIWRNDRPSVTGGDPHHQPPCLLVLDTVALAILSIRLLRNTSSPCSGWQC